MPSHKRSAPEDDSTTIQVKKSKVAAESSQQAKEKSKERPDHASSCDDPACTGCDEGEVELAFVRRDENGQEVAATPSAMELLAMAKSETNRAVAGRLYDMALDAFADEDKEHGKQGLGYARCLVELGRQLAVQESLREALTLYQSQKAPITSETRLWEARCALALALAIRLQVNNDVDLARDELDSEDDDDTAIMELMDKANLKREETKLYQSALTLLDDVAENIADNDHALFYQAIKDLLQYMEELGQPPHAPVVSIIGDALIRFLDASKAADQDALLMRAAVLLHVCKFVEPSERSKTVDEANTVLESIVAYTKEQKQDLEGRYYELLAMCRLEQANCVEDEDKVLACFDDAIDAFNKALELDPDNGKVQDMLETLTGSN
ncbi:hypothetical protein BC940DRAFT_286798 [Gongronella butleri]|nr:hypothetical protein BC940DRAFT_286798 [Gongronella butleri]